MPGAVPGAVPGLLCALLLCALSEGGKVLPWQRNGGGDFSSGSPSGKGCMNSVSGKWNLADDTGRVCSRDDVDGSGCCNPRKASRHTCSKCSEGCCQDFETCISCCLKNSEEGLFRRAFRSRGRAETGLFRTQFELCRGRCRTFSKVTVHENAYAALRHFCYGEEYTGGGGAAAAASSARKGAATGGATAAVVLVPGAVGVACTDVCARSGGRRCDQGSLAGSNSCEQLRKHFFCEGGCMKNSNSGAEPGYSTGGRQGLRRGTCLTGTGLTCEGKAEGIKRLCPCRA